MVLKMMCFSFVKRSHRIIVTSLVYIVLCDSIVVDDPGLQQFLVVY